MSRNWLRTCSLSFEGSSTAVVQGGGKTDLRIVFSIEQWSGQSPNMGRVRVYNPSQNLAAKLQAKEFTKITLTAGYEGNSGVIFSGDLRQYITGHETATDTFVDIFAADSEYGYVTATVNKTLSAGYTPQDKLKAATDAMAPYGTRLGLVNVDLSQPKYPRSLPILGMARDVIREVAQTVGATWSTQMGEIRLVDYRKPISAPNTVEMNGGTGMIGWPRQTPDGIIVTSLLNAKLQPHVNLKIDPNSIIQAEQDNNPISGPGSAGNQWLNFQNVTAGTYNIYKINRHGDTRGAEWFDESICIGTGGTLPPQALNNHYFLGNA